MLSTDRKGAIAEAEIAAAAIKLGVDVYRPLQEGGRYDLIFDLGGRLLRVQCKWAVRAGDVVVVRCYSSRRAVEGMRVRRYTAAEVDAIVAYCSGIDRCFVLPPQLFAGRPATAPAVGPESQQPTGTRQLGRRLRVRASTLHFARGAVAQLGERLAGSQKVRGSSPLGSIFPQIRIPLLGFLIATIPEGDRPRHPL